MLKSNQEILKILQDDYEEAFEICQERQKLTKNINTENPLWFYTISNYNEACAVLKYLDDLFDKIE